MVIQKGHQRGRGEVGKQMVTSPLHSFIIIVFLLFHNLLNKICQVDGPINRVLYHAKNNASSFCIKTFTFGVTNGLLYVKEGCSAMLTYVVAYID